MAEALGIASSILAIVDMSAKIVNYLHGVKNATAESKEFAHELQRVVDILNLLQRKATGKDQNLTESTKTQLKQGIQDFKKLLEDIGEKLGLDVKVEVGAGPDPGPSTASIQHRLPTGAVSWQNTMTWPFTKDEIKENLEKVERYKSFFNLLLTGDVL